MPDLAFPNPPNPEFPTGLSICQHKSIHPALRIKQRGGAIGCTCDAKCMLIAFQQSTIETESQRHLKQMGLVLLPLVSNNLYDTCRCLCSFDMQSIAKDAVLSVRCPPNGTTPLHVKGAEAI